jgi:4-amino-4-deoxy-L-arabinose transferase-like glycosyltransferase
MSLPTSFTLARVLDRAGAGRRPWLILCAVCLLLWLPGFFTLPPGDRDESRFAQATKQMVETGNLIQIRNGTEARNQKPIGIYWLQAPFVAAAQALDLGRANPIWPYRLPSLLGGLIAVLATYGFGRRLIGPQTALLGAGFLAASVILTTEVHIAKTDAALLAASTIAMGLLSRAWLAPATLRTAGAMGFWAALGCAILIKGPVAPMVCGLAVLWLAVADRKRGKPRWLLALQPRRGIFVLLAIVLPWFIAIGIATHGRFFAQSVGGDLAGKLAGSSNAHGAPFGLHLAMLPLLLFAGGPALIAAVPAIWRQRAAPPTRFLIAWIVPSWLVFELVATKLPHYPLPLYPAIALLAAQWMLAPAERFRSLARFACAVALVVVAGFGLADLALPFVVRAGLHTSDLLGVPGAVVAFGLIVLICRAWPDPRRAALLMLCAAPLFYGATLGLELPHLRALWIAPRVEAGLRAHWPQGMPKDGAFGSLGFAEPSLMFLCGTATDVLNAPLPAAQFLLAGPDRVLVVDDRQLSALAVTLVPSHTQLAPFATVEGYNYSLGRRVRLTLVSLAKTRPRALPLDPAGVVTPGGAHTHDPVGVVTPGGVHTHDGPHTP